jgi:sialate O-acetylesterase
MHALVGGWREAWNQGDFPFYWVQLANFQQDKNEPAGGDGYARIRDAQRQAQDIKYTGMAVIIDIGDTKDIHPKNKQDVGRRLAQWALARDYGKDVVPCGPLYKKHTIDGNKIRIEFDHVGGGLIVGEKNGLAPVSEDPTGKLSRFAIAGEDRNWVWGEAKIDGNTVVVSSPEVPKPVAVRYAFSGNPLGANLYNKDGFPASPFRTDDW